MTDAIIDPFKTNEEQVNYLEVVTNKFKNADGTLNVEGLARGKYEADSFIEQLKKELETERQKAKEGLSYAQLLEEIKRTNAGGEPPSAPANVTNPPTADELSKLVKDTLHQTTIEQKELANKATVIEKLNAEWGTNVASELAKKSRELGISVARLEEIGKESPAALFATLGLNAPKVVPGSATVPTSRVSFPNNSNGERTKSYYDDLYRKNPAAKYDSKIAAQEHRDAIRLGAAFFDN